MPRPARQRATENARYNDRRVAAGLVKLNVLVPVDRISELDVLLVEWRHKARALLNTDLPSAEQILTIHAMCRARRLKLPPGAFATRFAAEAWLRENRPAGRARRLVMPVRPYVS
jgi:hypothetical protein